jgi:hypothetical protein
MAYHNTCGRKPCLSEHQKQMRFFTRLLVGICALFAVVFFWLVNRSSIIPR